MERCPNCGQLSRLGAKFCTTCGQRFTGEEVGQVAIANEAPATPEEQPTGSTSADVASEDQQANGGWPSAPASSPDAMGPARAPANDTSSTPSESTDESVNGEGWPSNWLAEGARWPAPPTIPEPSAPAEEASDDTVVEAEHESESEGGEQEVEIEIAELESDEGVTAEVDQQTAQARERAAQLLDELREVVATLSGEAPPDLSGVISELEVAVTPPGAIGTEQLSELREALLKARQRPRDLDTVVDLTGRIDALVALVFAYDRTIAAIERSLEVLRGS